MRGRTCRVYSSSSLMRVLRSRGVSVPLAAGLRRAYEGEARCEEMSKVGWAVAER